MKFFYLQGHKFKTSSSFHVFLSVKVLYILYLEDNKFTIYKIFNLKNKYSRFNCKWDNIPYKVKLVFEVAHTYTDIISTLDIKNKTYYLSEDLNYLINKKKNLEMYL